MKESTDDHFMSVLQFALHSREYLWFSNENGWLKLLSFQAAVPSPGVSGVPKRNLGNCLTEGEDGSRDHGVSPKRNELWKVSYGKEPSIKYSNSWYMILYDTFFILQFVIIPYIPTIDGCHDLCFEKKAMQLCSGACNSYLCRIFQSRKPETALQWHIHNLMTKTFSSPCINNMLTFMRLLTLPETNSKSTWKWMVGILFRFLLGWPILRCEVSVSGSVTPVNYIRDVYHVS